MNQTDIDSVSASAQKQIRPQSISVVSDSANPVAHFIPDVSANGNITVINSVSTGVGTVGSNVTLTNLNGCATGLVDIRGTYTCTGGLVLQGTVDGTNWTTLNSSLMNETTGAIVTAIPSAAVGTWSYDAGVYVSMRITALGAVTGTAVVNLRAGSGSSLVALNNPLPAGTNSIGTVVLGTGSASVGTVSLVTPTPYALTSAATTNATSVKATAGTLYTITVDNVNAAARYLKLYNKASAPTVGTDVPVATIPLAATSFQSINLGTLGKRFSTGIAFAITGAMAVTDTTVIAVGDVHLGMDYV